jgi:hypothetical protein
MRNSIGSFVLTFLFCGLALTGCVDSDTTEALSTGVALKEVYRDWVRDGRPDVVNIEKYVSSNRSTFFIYTNTINLGANSYHCRFAVRSRNFRRKGFLAISDEQTLIWIWDNSNNVVIEPEKNLRFEH